VTFWYVCCGLICASKGVYNTVEPLITDTLINEHLQ
jgi:hypothetical protein